MIDLSTVPDKPGCYLYKDVKGVIIYVGKAKNLRKRVSQYFQKTLADEKTRQLVARIATADFIITNSEVEALLLENSLIKKHQPKYNINLKDAKQYAYLEVTAEEFPRLITLRDKTKATGALYGPFVSGFARQELAQFLIKTFKIRTCRKLPKRACLRYHLGLCDAPCINGISREEYLENVAQAEQVLKGKTSEARKTLEKKMTAAAKNEAFEQAQRYKEQLSALAWLEEKQTVERNKRSEEDIFNFHVSGETVYMMRFSVRKGTLEGKESFTFEQGPDWYESFLTSYYEDHDVPKEVILPRKVGKVTEAFLSLKAERKVVVTVPVQGAKKELLSLVKKNIIYEYFAGEERLEDLKEQLLLEKKPSVIECFDISHLSGTFTVASMVCFKDGKPFKSGYRRFKIKQDQNDDFLSMKEVVGRRYKRLQEEKKDFPDLIVIDGGKGQLNAAQEALGELGLTLPIISLAKKFEEIYLPGRDTPLRLGQKSKGLLLLRAVRDEAHRFAITYNRLLRKKGMKK